jgi:hypothetical protein
MQVRPHPPLSLERREIPAAMRFSRTTDDQKMIAGYEEPGSWREIEGGRLAREIILEPQEVSRLQ